MQVYTVSNFKSSTFSKAASSSAHPRNSAEYRFERCSQADSAIAERATQDKHIPVSYLGAVAGHEQRNFIDSEVYASVVEEVSGLA